MSNTIYRLKVRLELQPEPASGGTQGHPILHAEKDIPLTVDVLLSLLKSNTIEVDDFSFKLDPLGQPDPYTAESRGVGFLSPRNRTDVAILQSLLHDGWVISNPTDARKRNYPFPEDALVAAEGKLQPV